MIRTLSLVMTIVTYAAAAGPGKVFEKGIHDFGQGAKTIGQGIGQGAQAIGKGAEAAANGTQELGQNVLEGVQKEVVAVKNPIATTVAGIVFSQCKNVKKLFGLSYEQLKGEREPDVNKLKIVYATKNSREVYNISTAAESLQRAHAFESREKLVVFVHGFTDDPTKESFSEISDAFFKSDEGDNITLLALDGSPLIRWLYLRSSTYVAFMGQKLAEVLVALVQKSLNATQIHMVGHSLGAHICGFAGKKFFVLTGQKLGRISGLDPAGPCFSDVKSDYRLNATDATYVDVVHTDCGVYGIVEAVGHADYYPNGGTQQPNCGWETCSHSRSWELYCESIKKLYSFPAHRCDSYKNFTQYTCYDEISYMGYGSQPGTRGQFYLQTAGQSPYGLGEQGLNYTNNVGIIRNVEDAFGNLVG